MAVALALRAPRSRSLLLGALSVTAALIVWELAARSFFVPATLPAPTVVLAELLDRARSGKLAIDIGMSLMRIAVGFAGGSLLGAALGLAMGSIAWLRRLLEPPVQFFRFIPPIAWLTPVLIWFGIGETGKFVLIMYTTTFMVMVNTLAGTMAVVPNRVRAAHCFGASPLDVFLHVRLPSTVPYILTGMRIGMGNSFQTLIVAEMLAANEGLGFLIMNGRIQLATERIFVGIVLLAVIGLVSDFLFRAVARRLAWRFDLGW
jgi:ABC-type nitrate/sulfonate/bicarbonate transport system permease component